MTCVGSNQTLALLGGDVCFSGCVPGSVLRVPAWRQPVPRELLSLQEAVVPGRVEGGGLSHLLNRLSTALGHFRRNDWT